VVVFVCFIFFEEGRVKELTSLLKCCMIIIKSNILLSFYPSHDFNRNFVGDGGNEKRREKRSLEHYNRKIEHIDFKRVLKT